jgi:hypothetical protein
MRIGGDSVEAGEYLHPSTANHESVHFRSDNLLRLYILGSFLQVRVEL